MANQTSLVEPAALTATELPEDRVTLTSDAKLGWLKLQPIVDDNKISIGSSLAYSVKISDHCVLFIDLINATADEIQTEIEDPEIIAVAAKFIDTTTSSLWSFNEQLVHEVEAVLEMGKYAFNALIIRPSQSELAKVKDLNNISRSKSQIAEICLVIMIIYKSEIPNLASLPCPSPFAQGYLQQQSLHKPTAPANGQKLGQSPVRFHHLRRGIP